MHVRQWDDGRLSTRAPPRRLVQAAHLESSQLGVIQREAQGHASMPSGGTQTTYIWDSKIQLRARAN